MLAGAERSFRLAKQWVLLVNARSMQGTLQRARKEVENVMAVQPGRARLPPTTLRKTLSASSVGPKCACCGKQCVQLRKCAACKQVDWPRSSAFYG